MFNPHGNKDKVEIVVDNPLVNDELKVDTEKEVDTDKEEDTDKETSTPVQEIKPMNIEIPKLNLDNVVEDEMKRQNGGTVNINNANINSSKRGVKIVFSDDESDN
jgi:hypothetical protein